MTAIAHAIREQVLAVRRRLLTTSQTSTELLLPPLNAVHVDSTGPIVALVHQDETLRRERGLDRASRRNRRARRGDEIEGGAAVTVRTPIPTHGAVAMIEAEAGDDGSDQEWGRGAKRTRKDVNYAPQYSLD